MMKWIRSLPFVQSASLHGGELVVSYPFDFSKDLHGEKMFSPTPDEQVGRMSEPMVTHTQGDSKGLVQCCFSPSVHYQAFKQLARTYADAHATMSNNDTDRCGASFYQSRGIINGALWYSFPGGETNTSNYRQSCFHIIIIPLFFHQGLCMYCICLCCRYVRLQLLAH